MSFSTCPIATVNAPVDQVWRLLANPIQYDLWWEVRTRSIVPEGPARPGQQIFAQTLALGKQWPVAHLTVQAVSPEKWQLDLLTRLPLGISVYNHITCVPLDDQHTRVSFGRDFSISPGWWAWLWEHFGSQQLHDSVADALARLTKAAERLYQESQAV